MPARRVKSFRNSATINPAHREHRSKKSRTKTYRYDRASRIMYAEWEREEEEAEAEAIIKKTLQEFQ